MEERGWEYRRRQPEGTVLYEAVRDNLATRLAEAGELGRGLPRYVERDFAKNLECGVLAHGFARVRCESCKDELLVAFSCKGRGVCPSCNAKRAQVTAVHLVERVLPHVPLSTVDAAWKVSKGSFRCFAPTNRLTPAAELERARQRPSSAPALQPSPSTGLLFS